MTTELRPDETLKYLQSAATKMKDRSVEELMEEARSMSEFLNGLTVTNAQYRNLGAPQLLRAGYALQAIKDKVGEGNWEKFIKITLKGKISRAKVYRYLFAARAYGNPEEIPASLTMQELRARIRSVRAESGDVMNGKKTTAKVVSKLRKIERTIRDLASATLPSDLDQKKVRLEIEHCSKALRALDEAVHSIRVAADGRQEPRKPSVMTNARVEPTLHLPPFLNR